MGSVTNGGFVTNNGGWIEITVTEGTLDVGNNRSQITVTGKIINKGTGTSTHTTANITSSMTGTDSQGDSLFHDGALWAIGTLGPGKSKQFFSFTQWAAHDPGGGGSVNVAVHYGVTGTTIFGDNKGIGAQLTLTSLATAATSPGIPAFTNILPTSVTLTWDAPSDDGGWPISSYLIEAYLGDDTTTDTNPKQFTSNGTTKNVTGLQAGKDYTFLIYAYNGHGANGGYSTPSEPATVQMLAGSFVRVDGVWKIAVPYVRDGGVWKMAVPWVRTGDQWQQTH
jgi:hypothetical protein